MYCHQQTDCFILSELFRVARHAGRSKPGSKPYTHTHTHTHTHIYIYIYVGGCIVVTISNLVLITLGHLQIDKIVLQIGL